MMAGDLSKRVAALETLAAQLRADAAKIPSRNIASAGGLKMIVVDTYDDFPDEKELFTLGGTDDTQRLYCFVGPEAYDGDPESDPDCWVCVSHAESRTLPPEE